MAYWLFNWPMKWHKLLYNKYGMKANSWKRAIFQVLIFSTFALPYYSLRRKYVLKAISEPPVKIWGLGTIQLKFPFLLYLTTNIFCFYYSYVYELLLNACFKTWMVEISHSSFRCWGIKNIINYSSIECLKGLILKILNIRK